MTYEELIHDTFISPLRSVTIIDDQFPTWEDWLTDNVEEQKGDLKLKSGVANPVPTQQVLDTIKRFREMSPALNVDIHNGRDLEGNYNYFHQSDLIILDYELSAGEDPAAGSVKIAKELLIQNRYFNLIVLHTSENRLNIPFHRVLTALMSEIKWIDEGEVILGEEISDDNDFQGFVDEFAIEQFAAAYQLASAEKVLEAIKKCQEPFKGVHSKYDTNWGDEQVKSVIHYALRSYFIVHKAEMNDEAIGFPVLFKFNNIPWIRTPLGFMAFSNKGTHPDQIIALKEAIEDWRPTPSRMIATKIRGELDAQGVILEEQILKSNRVGFEQFLQMRENNGYLEGKIRAEIDRNFENIADKITKKVASLGQNLLDVDEEDFSDGLSKFSASYGITADQRADAKLDFNAAISLKSVSGSHLNLGHILIMDKRKFLVMTPACDLAPRDLQMARSSVVEVCVVELKEEAQTRKRVLKALKDATSNHYLFLPSDDKTQIIPHHIYKGDVNATSSPNISRWYISNGGVFQKDRNGDYLTVRILETANGQVVWNVKRVEVYPFQVRYEYALHFLGKVGAHLSRVGLDFVMHE